MTGPGGDRPNLVASIAAVSDRFVDAFIRSASDLLEDLYAAELRFTSHADGTVRDREQALVAFRTLRPHLHEVTLEIIDRDQDPATDDDRPTLFGQAFDGPTAEPQAGLPVHYDLEVWLWRHNPDGLFATFNRNVHCPAP